MLLLERLLDVIAPHSCSVCLREGSLLCSWCHADVCLSLPSRCFLCHAQTPSYAVCKSCRHKTRLGRVWVATEYTSVAKELIQSLKFRYKRDAAKVIAEYMHTTCAYLPDDVIIIAVPTASSRVRQRGFDHAKLISQYFATKHGRKNMVYLSRTDQSRQVGKKREMRLKQLEDAFYVTRPALVKSRSILLVDDVLTTGATLEAAAKSLKAAGAKSVSAIVFAQVK